MINQTLYQKDREWADSQNPEIEKIILDNLNKIVKVRISSDEEDTTKATDMVAEVENEKIAIRIRRIPSKNFKDITIRSRRESGHITELEKIKTDCVSWYLYCWKDRDSLEWLLLNIKKMNYFRLFTGRIEKQNKDMRTYFISIPINEIKRHGCIVAGHLNYKII
jgi:hypothetical protein